MGFLAREYAHRPWHPRAKAGPVVVDGIEGYAPYLGDLQRAIYDDLVVGEAIETIARMAEVGRRYDLVIAADILEHFSPVDARRFLDRCLRISTCVLIATRAATSISTARTILWKPIVLTGPSMRCFASARQPCFIVERARSACSVTKVSRGCTRLVFVRLRGIDGSCRLSGNGS
jgi:hypothetical protein